MSQDEKIKKPRIVFMGTPEFAVVSLDALLKAGYDIVGVVTAQDKASGRGMKLTQSAVKQYTVEHNLHLLQPEKLKAPDFLEALKSLNADIQVVVAFRMLPEVVWSMPAMGTINLHGSLLPKYRGAAPINWAVINGEKETGATTFKLQHAIDTGNILLQEKMPIAENETAGSVHDRMKVIGAALLVKTIDGVVNETLQEIPQDSIKDIDAIHAPKIFTETCKIDWSKNATQIHDLIRGLSPYPTAFTFLNDKMVKIFSSEKEMIPHDLPPGSINSDGKTFLKFACKDGFINIQELQMEGKKRMNIVDFLRGHSNVLTS